MDDKSQRMGEPTASEAVYAFSAWLTTRDQSVVIGSTHDAAVVAELVSLFVDSQEWAQPRDDYIDRLRSYPVETPQPAEPVKVDAKASVPGEEDEMEVMKDNIEKMGRKFHG